MEEERNGKTELPDTSSKSEDRNISFPFWYLKITTHTDQHSNFISNHQIYCKKSVISFLFNWHVWLQEKKTEEQEKC